MAKEPHERVEVKGISMYPAEWALVEGWARDNGFNVSLALRRIIHEWAECKDLTRLVDTKEPYISKSQQRRLAIQKGARDLADTKTEYYPRRD